MGILQSKLITNRRRKNDESFQIKSQLPELPDETTTKIIDLNDDCLIKIFGHLDLQNLFNVAVANEFLRPAAYAVYKREFTQKRVVITPHTSFPSKICSIHNGKEDSCIRIYGARAPIQYLRCFGGSIEDLEIDYNGAKSKRYHFIHHYINEYCAESLIQLSFSHTSKLSITNFAKPFTNVTMVSISFCKLHKQLPLLVKLFPNLRSLSIYHVRLTRGFHYALFQHLEHLCIYASKKSFLPIDASNLLYMNRQVQRLEIQTYGKKITMKTLLDIIKDNQSITKLIVKHHFAIFSVKEFEVQRLVSEHPSLIELDLDKYRFTLNNAMELIQRLKLLKIFRFGLEKPDDLDRLKTKLEHSWRIDYDWKFVCVTLFRKTLMEQNN